MSIVPKVSIQVSGNRCRCCDNSARPQPKDLVVYYCEKKKKFIAVPRDNSPISPDEKIIAVTRENLEKFFNNSAGAEPNKEYSFTHLATRLPSLDEVNKIAEEVNQSFRRSKSDD